MEKDKTLEEIQNEISELVTKAIGNINNIDSKTQKAEVVMSVLNSIIAGIELSKIEKAGILVYLQRKRVG